MPRTISPLSRSGSVASGNAIIVLRGRLTQADGERRPDRRLGKAAQRAHLLFERPHAGKLSDRGKQGDTALGDAQALHQARRCFAEILVVLDCGGDLVKKRIGAFLDESGQEMPLPDREPAQERAVAKDRGQQASALRLRAPAAGGMRHRVALGGGKRFAPGLEAERAKPQIRRLRQVLAIGREAVQQFHADFELIVGWSTRRGRGRLRLFPAPTPYPTVPHPARR